MKKSPANGSCRSPGFSVLPGKRAVRASDGGRLQRREAGKQRDLSAEEIDEPAHQQGREHRPDAESAQPAEKDEGQSERERHQRQIEAHLDAAEAQVKAQANLDNGGNTDLDRHAKTPLPPAPRHQEGDDLEHSQKRIQALEARQQRLATQAQSKAAISPKTDREVQPEPAPNLSGRDLARSALAMARLEGEIAKDLDDYNKRPRRKFIGTSAVEFRFAQYFEEWRLKVERIGTLNYPEAARGKLYGSLVLTVAINSDGTVAGIEINRSSGYKILDDAARRIVAMAAPFAAFPPAIRRDTDILEITRTWNFTQRDSLETGKATKR